jgi:hypothetical protein
MKIENSTPFLAEVTIAVDKLGYEQYLLIIKGTFDLPTDGGIPSISDVQRPFAYADEYYGDPSTTSIREGFDFAIDKPKTDVVVVGSARAPRGMTVTQIDVRLRVSGLIDKTIRVTGDRVWERVSGSARYRASSPKPFEKIPLVYERAYGGFDTTHPSEKRHHFHRENLVGVGSRTNDDPKLVVGTKLPNLEIPGQQQMSWNQKVSTAGFSFVCPHWMPRIGYAGTYGANWMNYQYPLLPKDFNEFFYQSAPADQIVNAIVGGEKFELSHVHSDHPVKFILPTIEIPVIFMFLDRGDLCLKPRLDTVTIWADEGKLSLVWRICTRPMGKLYSLRKIVLGERSKRWFQMQRSWKPYFKSVSDFIEWKSLQR